MTEVNLMVKKIPSRISVAFNLVDLSIIVAQISNCLLVSLNSYVAAPDYFAWYPIAKAKNKSLTKFLNLTSIHENTFS